ncbi:MAG TPA: PBP1A family penicillin-binding protein [Spirochaetota bacterium]|nr:PBP1A family penicillin-binding protein [Spirochaetota bacterium]
MSPEVHAAVRRIEKIAIIVLFVICLLGGIFFGFITSEIKNFSGIDNLRQFQPSIPTRLYDVNGELIAELFQEKRDLVAYEELPRNLVNAFIATEDRDFYHHIGINPLAIFRAFVKNILAGKIVQGGSTITQQLAKRLFTSGARTIMRKVLEAILALQIERKFTKQEILEMYFNQIYLGHGCYGVASASKLFFDKDVRQLNVVESAILAALPSAPGRNSPLLNPRTAYRVNENILERMVDNEFLADARAVSLYREFWPVYIDSIMTEYPSKTVFSKDVDKAPFFTDYVRQILIARFGKDVVYNEGLSVYTTLNLRRQEAAEKYLVEGVRRQNEVSTRANQYYLSAVDRSLFGAYSVLQGVFSLPGVIIKNDIETQFKKKMVDELIDSVDMISLLVNAQSSNHTLSRFREAITGISSAMTVEGAMIAIEPPTGYISVMVGGREFSVNNQFNRAMQAKRQPGSAFKPFVYGTGIESGQITAVTSLPDVPIVDIDAAGESWTPANYEGGFSGMVQIHRALAKSINIISIRIYDLVGPDKIANFAGRMLNVPENRFTPSPTLALGATEVTPFEMARGFAVYANRGRDVIPFAVRYVIDRDGAELVNIEEEVGSIIAAKEKNGTIQVISEEVAFIMTSLMQNVVEHGTPYYGVRSEGRFMHPCAGKTGTTSNWTDVWFCGYTPDLSAVVWMGYDRQFMSLGKNMAAASIAAPIWGHFMREVYNGMPAPVFPQPPEGVYRVGNFYLLKGTHAGPSYADEKYKMKTVIERYMEKQGLTGE